MSAEKIKRGKQDNCRRRNDRSENRPDAAQDRIKSDAAEIQDRASPHDGRQSQKDKPPVRGKFRLENIGERRRDERQNRGIPRQAVQPLHTDGDKSPFRAERLLHPEVHSAVLRPCRRQLRRDKRRRNEEADGSRRDVEDDCIAVFGLFRKIYDGQDCGNIQHRQREYAHFITFLRKYRHIDPPIVMLVVL